jgi:phage baseplate assembly protein V
MNDLATHARLLENLIRLGTIHAVQMSPPRVQVKTGSLITTWLPWLASRAGETREWNPPTVGEQVILLSPSGQLANGVVLTGLFSDLIPANGALANLHRVTYPDGAVIEYDSAAHALNALLPAGGTAALVALGGIRIEGDITHTGNLHINGGITTTEDVVAGTVSLKGHRHPGDSGGTTGAPIQ